MFYLFFAWTKRHRFLIETSMRLLVQARYIHILSSLRRVILFGGPIARSQSRLLYVVVKKGHETQMLNFTTPTN